MTEYLADFDAEYPGFWAISKIRQTYVHPHTLVKSALNPPTPRFFFFFCFLLSLLRNTHTYPETSKAKYEKKKDNKKISLRETMKDDDGEERRKIRTRR